MTAADLIRIAIGAPMVFLAFGWLICQIARIPS